MMTETEKERQRVMIEAKLDQAVAKGPVKTADGRVLQLTMRINAAGEKVFRVMEVPTQ
jgi:hypothetical protein